MYYEAFQNSFCTAEKYTIECLLRLNRPTNVYTKVNAIDCSTNLIGQWQKANLKHWILSAIAFFGEWG